MRLRAAGPRIAIKSVGKRKHASGNNSFTDAFTSTTSLLVPQNGTAQSLDTLGDKIMTPVVYQNLAGVESLWASHTINNNEGGTGPTAIRC